MTNAMPQFFADRFGWPEMAAAVARAYYSLPPADGQRRHLRQRLRPVRRHRLLRPRYGLPKSIGGHLATDLGSAPVHRPEPPGTGDDRQTLEQKFEVVVPMAQIGHPYAMMQEHFTLFWVRKPRGFTLQSAWPQLKKFE